MSALALFGHAVAAWRCPLLGVKRTSGNWVALSESDPERTLGLI